MPLSKSQIAASISKETGIGKNLVTRVLTDLADLAADELDKGEDFVVPGICRLTWGYRKPQKKGERWKKGETYTGFGGVEKTADADSPPVKAQIKLKAAVTGLAGKAKPGTKPDVQAAFLKSPTGKAVIKRKG